MGYLALGIGMTDTTNGLTQYWIYANIIELTPNWQMLKTPPITNSVEYVHEVGVDLYLYTPDSTYCGLEILFNNLWFVYENGDTVLVDPFQYTFPSGVIEQLPGIPTGFVLHQNYPNPFNPSTKIRYEISEPSPVKLTIYSLLGEKIAGVVDEFQNAGIYEADFDASALSTGTYLYVLQTDKFTLRKKMILLK